MPGPLFFTALLDKTVSGVKGGLVLSIAHSFIELCLILILATGIVSVFHEPTTKIIIGFIGGFSLLIYGFFQIIGSYKSTFEAPKKTTHIRNSFLLGLFLTGLNPFFIVWWITIGSSLIFMALDFASLMGITIMYFSHIWMDFFWLTITAALAKKGHSIIKSKWYLYSMYLFGGILIIYGLFFLTNSFSIILN
jgi:threonine/homoserine/homoserine lactone efflux protein